MSDHRRLYAPRHWPVWAALGLFWLATALPPYGAVQAMGRWIGRAAYRIGGRRRHITRVNLALCFPELTEEQRERLTRDHFEAMGIALMMTGFAWWASDRKVERLYHPEGREHVDRALAAGGGAILLGHHFTDMEIVGRMAARHNPIAVVYREHNHPVLEWAFRRNREKRFAAAISHEDIRSMIKALRKQGIAVWYAPDQAYNGPHSALVPFFGVPAATHTGTSAIARLSKAPVILVHGHRLPGNAGYRVVAQPPLEGFPSDDPAADAARINALYEQTIRQAPEQYLWSHRRFKKRKGLADPYRPSSPSRAR